MKKNLVLFLITSFLMANTYYDGKFTNYLVGYKKYFKMATFAFVGLSLYTFMKKNPNNSSDLIKNASELIKYMPIDSNTSDVLTPLFDFTNTYTGMNNIKSITKLGSGSNDSYNTPQFKRMMNSGRTSSNRSVSETKKKYVASQQSWMCGHCGIQLDASYEIDHIIELQNGGTNHVDNLTALCRNCHGKKTMMNKL